MRRFCFLKTSRVIAFSLFCGIIALSAGGSAWALKETGEPVRLARSDGDGARKNLIAPPSKARKFRSNRHDHDGIRAGVKSGYYVPLSKVLKNIRKQYAGKHLDTRTRLSPDESHVHYEIRWLTPDGRRLDITADATTGLILHVKGL